MSIDVPINLYNQRPAQQRSFETQAAELGLDPLGKSPVEADLGYALLGLLLDPDEFGAPGFINLFMPQGSISSLDEMPPIRFIAPGVINVAPGCWVDRYQSDFLLDVKTPRSKRIVRGTLECDGHNYHDRTPEQASHDRARDRQFQDQGIYVLRYTATDIAEDPKHCARDAINILLRRSAMRERV